MSGPVPKPAATRQRRNREATAAKLTDDRGRRALRPRLPKERAWHAATRRWWRDVWSSPMAKEFVQSDVNELLLLARLVDDFWATGDTELLGEIRLQRQCFGLTPIDRRRLQWEVERVRMADTRRELREKRPTLPAGDPREALK